MMEEGFKDLSGEELLEIIDKLEKRTQVLERERRTLRKQIDTQQELPLAERLVRILNRAEQKASQQLQSLKETTEPKEPEITFEQRVEEDVRATLAAADAQAQGLLANAQESANHYNRLVNERAGEIKGQAMKEYYDIMEECNRLRNDLQLYIHGQWSDYKTRAEEYLKEDEDLQFLLRLLNASGLMDLEDF